MHWLSHADTKHLSQATLIEHLKLRDVYVYLTHYKQRLLNINVSKIMHHTQSCAVATIHIRVGAMGQPRFWHASLSARTTLLFTHANL